MKESKRLKGCDSQQAGCSPCQAARQIKKNLIEACVHVLGADGLIQEREAELLRAIADTLDCPIPPFVEIAES